MTKLLVCYSLFYDISKDWLEEKKKKKSQDKNFNHFKNTFSGMFATQQYSTFKFEGKF